MITIFHDLNCWQFGATLLVLPHLPCKEVIIDYHDYFHKNSNEWPAPLLYLPYEIKHESLIDRTVPVAVSGVPGAKYVPVYHHASIEHSTQIKRGSNYYCGQSFISYFRLTRRVNSNVFLSLLGAFSASTGYIGQYSVCDEVIIEKFMTLLLSRHYPSSDPPPPLRMAKSGN